MSSDALAYLDDLNEEGRIEYDDYRNLHDLISAETPTDDEVEALRIAHLDARQAAYRKEREDWFVDHEAEPEIATNAFFRGWDAAVGGGFRRSEVVPEPSAEVVELRKQIEKLDADLGQQIDRTEELHDIADRLSWAIAPMSEIGEHSSANDPWENAIEYAASRQWCGGIHICSNAEHDHQEPQGEPSDAGVDDAWWKAQEAGQLPRTPGPSIRQAFKAGYRAALRAAGVGGAQAEERTETVTDATHMCSPCAAGVPGEWSQ